MYCTTQRNSAVVLPYSRWMVQTCVSARPSPDDESDIDYVLRTANTRWEAHQCVKQQVLIVCGTANREDGNEGEGSVIRHPHRRISTISTISTQPFFQTWFYFELIWLISIACSIDWSIKHLFFPMTEAINRSNQHNKQQTSKQVIDEQRILTYSGNARGGRTWA